MENVETQRRVREVYLRFVENGELTLVDGNASKEKVGEELLKLVLAFLERVC
jgi:thymidylate kinase